MGKQASKIERGDAVAFNNLADATWFIVLAVDGFALTVREVGREEYAPQSIDSSVVKQVRKAPKDGSSDVYVEFTGKHARLVSYDASQLRHVLSQWTPAKLADAKRMAKSHGAQLTMADGQ